MGAAIICRNLHKEFLSYKKEEGMLSSLKGFIRRETLKKEALRNINLEIESGIIVGLVGANGAGKTTLLKILSGLVHPTSGEVEVLGYKPFERQNDFLAQMSILLGQKNQLWWDISPRDSFNLLGAIYGLDDGVLRRRVGELAEMLQCQGQLDIQLRRLSLGERMKMEIIGSLLHKPKVLFLDEPTIGLDIVAQTSIRRFLEHYVQVEKPTIILTSHYMDDIAQLSRQLILIGKGEIKYSGTVEEFTRARSNLQKVICRLSAPASQKALLFGEYLIHEGEEIIQAELSPHQVGDYLSALMKIGTIAEIKVEETDFEEVIQRFLEKDLGGR